MRSVSFVAAGAVCAALGCVMLLVLLTGSPGAASAQDEPWATQAVQVTDNPDPTRAHTSPQIARHPDTGELVIVEGHVRASQRCVVHISADDGRTWTPGGDLMPSGYPDCTLTAEYGPYATLAFADDGTLYVAFIASEFDDAQGRRLPEPGAQRNVFLARSTDAGRTFDHTMIYQTSGVGADRDMNKGPMLAVHPTDASRVYVGWRQGEHRSSDEKLKSNIAASSDAGQTFGEPVDVSDELGGDYPAVAVDSDGTVHAVYWNRSYGLDEDDDRPAEIRYARSTDHGETYSAHESIDPGNQRTARPPVLVADPSGGTLYIVWYANQEAMNQREDFEDPRHDVLLRRSSDGGDTWSDRVVLNDDDAAVNQFDPGVAIAPNGRVDVAWYDFRDSPTLPADVSAQGGESGFAHVYYTTSHDGGATFSPNVRVSDRMIDRSVGVWSNRVDSKHNIGITSTDTSAYVAWQDTRNAHPELQAEDVYAAVVRTGEPVDQTQASAFVSRLQGAGAALLAGGLLLLLVGLRGPRQRPGPM